MVRTAKSAPYLGNVGLKLFPELVDVNYRATAARIIPSGKLAKELKERHLMKDRPLCIPHLS